MIVEKIAGNTCSLDIGERRVESVRVHSDDLAKRILRLTTDSGREIGIRLAEPKDLCDGDVLYMDEERAIVLRVIPERLLVITPRSLREMGVVAHQIGNRHIPAQFEEDAMLVQYDALLEEMLKELGVAYTVEERAVRKAFRPVGHSHHHNHHHSHHHG